MGILHNNSSIGGIIKLVQEYFKSFYTELKKYNDGIHILNEGVSEEDLSYFENKYKIYLPFYYREWLKINNGGELFAIPVGTTIAGILGNKPHEQGIPYLEDNFNTSKREGGMPNYLFIIA
ncbi:MAG: SMI1/KNR4 family protein, partial [Acetatifactor sp.]|nr:SMI1/KNR4 family protein [Acetatifactor sp.]